MTPAQKKSLSPLKTINMAALDNFYQDNDNPAEGSKKRVGKKKTAPSYSSVNNVIPEHVKSSNSVVTNSDNIDDCLKKSPVENDGNLKMLKECVTESEAVANQEKIDEKSLECESDTNSEKKNNCSNNEIRTKNVIILLAIFS